MWLPSPWIIKLLNLKWFLDDIEFIYEDDEFRCKYSLLVPLKLIVKEEGSYDGEVGPYKVTSHYMLLSYVSLTVNEF